MSIFNKKRVIPFLFSFLLVSTLLFGFAVTPVLGFEITLTDFDDLPSGSTNGTSGYFDIWSPNEDSHLEVSTSHDYSSPHSFKFYADGGATPNFYCSFWNLTSSFSYVSVINFTIYWSTMSEEGECGFIFKDATNTSLLHIKTGYHAVDPYLRLDGVSDSYIYKDNDAGHTNRMFITIVHNSTNSFWVRAYNDTGVLVRQHTGSGAASETWTTFTHIYAYVDGAGGATEDNYIYLDDFVVSDSGSGGSGVGDLSNYDSYCTGGSGSYWTDNPGGSNRYWEQTVNVPLNTNISAVDLYVGRLQIEDVNDDLLDYQLYVNGDYCGVADYIIDDGDGYTIRWLFDAVILSDEFPVFEFGQSSEYVTYGGVNYYWYSVGVNLANNFGHGKHDVLDQFGDGVQQGDYNYDLALCFYHTPYLAGSSYDDSVFVQPLGRDQYLEYENLFITATVSVLDPTTYVRLYRDGVRVNAVGYDEYGLHDGKPVETTDGVFQCSYVPSFDSANCSSGSDLCWNVSLWRSGSCVASYNFSVINRDAEDYNGLIWTMPNPSGLGSTFAIEWLYNSTYWDNKDGSIYWSYDSSFDIDDDNLIVSNIDADGDLAFSYDLNRPLYFILVVDDTVPYPIFVHKHYVGDLLTHSLSVLYDDFVLGDGECFDQVFTGYNGLFGTDVYIKINGEIVFNVRDKNKFGESLEVCDAGYYEATLEFYQVDGWVELASCVYVVTSEGGVVDPGVVPVDVVFGDSEWLMPIAFVIVCCVALGFAYVAASGAMGLLGGLLCTMFFATPNHPFTVFPVVWLFICGLAMIIIVLYLSRG